MPQPDKYQPLLTYCSPLACACLFLLREKKPKCHCETKKKKKLSSPYRRGDRSWVFLQEPEGGSGAEVLLPVFRGEPPSDVPGPPWAFPSDMALFPCHSRSCVFTWMVENLDF